MASSGKIIGGYLTGRGQRLEIEWTQEKDTANKRSIVRCVVYIRHKNATQNADSARDFEASCTGKTTKELRTKSWTCGSESQLRQLLVEDPIVWYVSCNATTGKHSPITLGFRYNYKGESNLWVTASAQIQLDDVPMGGIISYCTNTVAPGGQVSLTLKQYVTSYYARLAVSGGGQTLITEDLAGTIDAFNFGVPIGWMTLFPSSQTGTITVTYTTYSNAARTTQVGEASVKTVTLDARGDPGLVPTATAGWAVPEPENTGTRAAGLNAYVAGMTKIRGVFDTTKIDAKYGASPALRSIIADGQSASADFAQGTPAPVVGPVMSAGDKAMTMKVTDSRGLMVSITQTVKYWGWTEPQVVGAVAYRCDSLGDEDNEGTYLAVRAGESHAEIKDPSGTAINNASLGVYWRQAGSAVWSAKIAITAGSTAVLNLGLSISSAYEVMIEAEDTLGGTGTVTFVIPKSSVTLNFRAGGDGACFGGYATRDGLQVDWDTISVPNLTTINGGVVIRAEDDQGTVKLFRVIGVEETTP